MQAEGRVHTEPEHSVYEVFHVRLMNGVYEVRSAAPTTNC